MTCKEDDCDRKAHARGMCQMHYMRWDRANDPERWREYNRKHQTANRERIRKQARERYRANPAKGVETSRRSRVKRKYGLSLEEYEAKIAEGCSICGAHGPRMAMDHCHTTGKVRAPLCSNCNNGLGRFLDRPDLLRAAADYLERHE